MCFCLGSIAHPIEASDTLAESGLEVLNKLSHLFLRLGREVTLYVYLTESFAENAVNQVDRTTPARVLLLATAKSLSVELKRGEREVVTKVASSPIYFRSNKVVFNLAEVCRGEPLVEFIEVVVLGYVPLFEIREIALCKVCVPIKALVRSGKLLNSHKVIVGTAVAQLLLRVAHLSELTRDLCIVFGNTISVFLAITGKSKHLIDVLVVFL